jgi:hypothetical protein
MKTFLQHRPGKLVITSFYLTEHGPIMNDKLIMVYFYIRQTYHHPSGRLISVIIKICLNEVLKCELATIMAHCAIPLWQDSITRCDPSPRAGARLQPSAYRYMVGIYNEQYSCQAGSVFTILQMFASADGKPRYSKTKHEINQKPQNYLAIKAKMGPRLVKTTN